MIKKYVHTFRVNFGGKFMSDHNKKISYGCILNDKDDTIFFDLSLDSVPDKEEKAKLYKSLKVSAKKVIQRLKENEVD